MVRGEQGVVVDLVGSADQMHEREHPSEHLCEIVGLVEPADRHLRPERAERFRGLGIADRGPHLVLSGEQRHEGVPDRAGGPGDHDRHGPDATERPRQAPATGVAPATPCYHRPVERTGHDYADVMDQLRSRGLPE